MKVSFNGLRRNLRNDVMQLKTVIDQILCGAEFSKGELYDGMDQVISQTNILLSCFDPDVEDDCNDLSALCMPFLHELQQEDGES